jgi:hypothetical protein
MYDALSLAAYSLFSRKMLHFHHKGMVPGVYNPCSWMAENTYLDTCDTHFQYLISVNGQLRLTERIQSHPIHT